MGMLMSRVINNNRYKQNVQGRCSTLNIICKSPKGGGTFSHSSSVERVTLQYKNTDVGINLLEEINNLKEEINNLKEERNNLKEKNNLKEEINNFNAKQKINQFSKKKLINSRVAAVDNTTKQCAREKRKTRRGNGKTRRQWKNKGSTCRRRRRRRRRRPKKKKVVRRSQGGRGMRSQIRKKRSREEKELCGDADLEKRKRQEEARTGEEQEVGSDGK